MKLDYDIYDYAQNNEPFHVIHLSLHITTKRKLLLMCMFVAPVPHISMLHNNENNAVQFLCIYIHLSYTVFPTFVSIFVENVSAFWGVSSNVCMCV